MKHVHIVAGGQFGSEGKGAFTAALVRQLQAQGITPTLVRVAGPNAGHTAYDDQGRKWALRQIPVGAVVSLDSTVVIGQQSEIDLAVLEDEITRLEAAGIPILNRLAVDPTCTVIEPDHVAAETSIETGTTGKGIGGARAARLMRKAPQLRDVGSLLPMCDTVSFMRAVSDTVVVEGTQGYGLGLHTRYYPSTTSSNCRCGDFLAMTGLQPWEFESVFPWVVFRSHPIRIAGNSGPLENEVTWEDVGQDPEYTTVTKKVRRVGLWDQVLAQEALLANGAPRVNVAFTFGDYLRPEVKGADRYGQDICHLGAELEEALGHPIRWIGTSPTTGVWQKNGSWL